MAFQSYLTKLESVVERIRNTEIPPCSTDCPMSNKMAKIMQHMANSNWEAAQTEYAEIVPEPEGIIDYRIGHIIAYNKLTELVETFAKYMFVQDRKTGFLPLHLAIYLGDVEMVEKIVDYRFVVESSRPNGTLATAHFDHCSNDDGLTVYDMALLHRQTYIFNYLVSRSCEEDAACLNTISVPSATKLVSLDFGDATEEIFTRLKDLGVDFNQDLSGSGMTFLHLAAKRASRRTVLALIAVDADPTITNISGMLPVEIAIFGNNYPVVLDLFRTPVQEFSQYEAVFGFLQSAGEDDILRALVNGPVN